MKLRTLVIGTVLSVLLAVTSGCAPGGEPPQAAATLNDAELAGLLQRLDADFARLKAAEEIAEVAPISFVYRAPDRVQADALAATLANSTPYPVEVREDPARGWLVVGRTALLVTEVSEHEELVGAMLELGSNHGCKLLEWTPAMSEEG